MSVTNQLQRPVITEIEPRSLRELTDKFKQNVRGLVEIFQEAMLPSSSLRSRRSMSLNIGTFSLDGSRFSPEFRAAIADIIHTRSEGPRTLGGKVRELFAPCHKVKTQLMILLVNKLVEEGYNDEQAIKVLINKGYTCFLEEGERANTKIVVLAYANGAKSKIARRLLATVVERPEEAAQAHFVEKMSKTYAQYYDIS